MKDLFPILSYFPSLTELNLSNINLPPSNITLLTNNFDNNCFISLRKLSISSIKIYNLDWKIDSISFKYLCNSIQTNHLSELREIHIISTIKYYIIECGISSLGLIYFSRSIIYCPLIQIIDIYDSIMSTESIIELSKNLSCGKCPDLEILDISCINK